MPSKLMPRIAESEGRRVFCWLRKFPQPTTSSREASNSRGAIDMLLTQAWFTLPWRVNHYIIAKHYLERADKSISGTRPSKGFVSVLMQIVGIRLRKLSSIEEINNKSYEKQGE